MTFVSCVKTCDRAAFRTPGVFLHDVLDEDVVRLLATQEKGER